jgi:hypothetical protein
MELSTAVLIVWFLVMLYLIYHNMTEGIGREFKHQGPDVAKRIREDDRRALAKAAKDIGKDLFISPNTRSEDERKQRADASVRYWMKRKQDKEPRS